jgi:clan AA aspartic protease (TIGR02281 family)
MYSTGVITAESTKDLYNENSVLYNEITTECLGDILKSNKAKIHSDKEITKSTVIGTKAFSKIDLLFLESVGYKIKLNIAGLERYFIFDTGASMMVIDQKLADELQKRKALKEEDILINSKFQLANGTIITSKIMELNNVRVGDYTLNNLEVAVIENGTLLFGSNALNNFSKWEINKDKKTLTLYK